MTAQFSSGMPTGRPYYLEVAKEEGGILKRLMDEQERLIDFRLPHEAMDKAEQLVQTGQAAAVYVVRVLGAFYPEFKTNAI